jgi:all-beta uncharacterized protein
MCSQRLRSLAVFSSLALATVTISSHTAEASGSFVYLLGRTCFAPTVCEPVEQIYDASTGAVVAQFLGGLGDVPAGIAISPDGRRVYFSISPASGPPFVSVLDATIHDARLALQTAAAGKLAVTRDGARLLLMTIDTVYAYDTATKALVATVTTPGEQLQSVAANPAADRFYVVSWGFSPAPHGVLREFDISSGTPVAARTLTSQYDWLDVHLSRDGSRLYATASASRSSPSIGGALTIVEPVGWQVISELKLLPSALGTIDSLSRHRMYTWYTNHVAVLDRDSLGSIVDTSIAAPVSLAIAADESRSYVPTKFDSGMQAGANALGIMNLVTNTIDRTIALAAEPVGVVATPPNAASDVCSYRVDTHQISVTSSASSGQVHVTTSCYWQASVPAAWVSMPVESASGTGNGTVSLSIEANPNAGSRSATLTVGGQLVTITQAGLVSNAPFGYIDTPGDNATNLTGALSVSGWALDDIGVARVRIYRDPIGTETPGVLVYIGDGTFVDGARTDVQALYPALPFASRAGWGYMLLSNMLPNRGSGTYRFYVYADDVEGQTTFLGSRTITCDNTSLSLPPFGTIDTPGQGETVAGTIVNFGWALSGAAIATDGSTIHVVIDGAVVGHPVYNNFRSDIASLFPGYPNSDGAVGYFVIDTTTLSNGVHTIAWIVTDSGGRTQGIGSRFFTVANP